MMMSDSNMNEKQATENKENEQGENQKYTIELKNVTKR